MDAKANQKPNRRVRRPLATCPITACKKGGLQEKRLTQPACNHMLWGAPDYRNLARTVRTL